MRNAVIHKNETDFPRRGYTCEGHDREEGRIHL